MNQKTKSARRYIRNDIILVIALLLIAALGILYLFVFRGAGDTVRVTVDGVEYGVFELSRDVTEDIYTGKDGEHHNRLVIKDGKAYMESANCPDGICVEHSRIFRDAESIVCLPHRVVITVVTDGDSAAPDLVV